LFSYSKFFVVTGGSYKFLPFATLVAVFCACMQKGFNSCALRVFWRVVFSVLLYFKSDRMILNNISKELTVYLQYIQPISKHF